MMRQVMLRLQAIFKSNDGSIVAIKEPTATITCICRHSLECIGNRLRCSLHERAIADFNVQKYEEAKGSKALSPKCMTMLQSIVKVRTVVVVQWDSLCCVRRRKKYFGVGIFKQKRMVVIFLARAFLPFWYFN
jgi:hypothetical protein